MLRRDLRRVERRDSLLEHAAHGVRLFRRGRGPGQWLGVVIDNHPPLADDSLQYIPLRKQR